MHFRKYVNKKASEVCIKALHLTCGGLVQPGDYTSYCEYEMFFIFIFFFNEMPDDKCFNHLVSSLCSYNSIKTYVQGGNTKNPLGPLLHMTTAAEAGILTLILTNPVWVVKTR